MAFAEEFAAVASFRGRERVTGSNRKRKILFCRGKGLSVEGEEQNWSVEKCFSLSKSATLRSFIFLGKDFFSIQNTFK